MDDTRIDEDVLHTLLKGVYGEAAAKQFRLLYNAVSDLIEAKAEDAWHEGYEVGFKDSSEFDEPSEADVDLVAAAVPFNKVITKDHEQQAADEAQLTMDALWGSINR